MDLDPRYLESFLVVGRERSFSRAAGVLHKTQPAVSYQIRKLEDQLATRLFDRTTRELTLTAPGARLFALCEQFFGEFGRYVAALRDPAGAPLEPVRIASVSSFGRYVLFPVLATMPAGLRYTLRFPTAAEVFAALDDGACDLGFVYLPVTSSRIAATPVWREELVLIAPPRTRGLPRELAAFGGLPFVAYDESEYVFGKWFEAGYGRQPRTLHVAYHFEEVEEVVATVADGRGWSIVPDHCLRGRGGQATAVLRHPRRRAHNIVYAVTRAAAPDHPGRTAILEALRATRATSPAMWIASNGRARRR
jgi:LysR family transcriptional regulator, cyn operon transcriptional activator